ncbi:MAG: cysteine desulfurase family protein [Aquabacterium sp.]|uniref:cysteine desulfurase family protein n=1 Tax=Aquabacterium sp. TaxID=1872578 RepID=UPI0027196170|nr:cysteine desulfurase family protein [Aquabacterium sp.]MDO9001822.1 cysteine desulfurase family protein [Aquabacterium sp.]
MNTDRIYLDNNATTAPTADVMGAVAHGLIKHWANPSSPHAMGQEARQALMQARTQLARMLGCKPAEVVFTSGATESNHIALRGAVGFNGRQGLVLSAAEHAGVQKLARHLAQRQQANLGWIGLTPEGTLDMAQARDLVTPHVALVSVMAANNETGVLMPIGEMARLAHAQGAMLHVDATQLIGKLPFDFDKSGADLVSLSAHKFHGPKGVGALIVRQGLNWPALYQGSQERARRGGTENLPGILGLAAATERLTMAPQAWFQHMASQTRLRDQLEQGLLSRLPGTVVFGGEATRLPNTSYLRFGHLHADVVLQRLERLGIMASSGAACSASGNEPSFVLSAMGIPREEALCAIRFSLSIQTTSAQIQTVLDRLPAELAPLMAEHAAAAGHPAFPSGAFA